MAVKELSSERIFVSENTNDGVCAENELLVHKKVITRCTKWTIDWKSIKIKNTLKSIPLLIIGSLTFIHYKFNYSGFFVLFCSCLLLFFLNSNGNHPFYSLKAKFDKSFIR